MPAPLTASRTIASTHLAHLVGPSRPRIPTPSPFLQRCLWTARSIERCSQCINPSVNAQCTASHTLYVASAPTEQSASALPTREEACYACQTPASGLCPSPISHRYAVPCPRPAQGRPKSSHPGSKAQDQCQRVAAFIRFLVLCKHAS